MAGSFAAGTAAGGKNFVIQKSEKGDQLKPIVNFYFFMIELIEMESIEIKLKII